MIHAAPFDRGGRVAILRLAVWTLLALTAAARCAAQPAAPGFGSKARGGQGGRVLIVDTLEDRVAKPPRGSLRWALEQRGKRIIVFRVAGTIELAGKLVVRKPFVTVAGQTAPGDGITLKNYPV